MIHIRIQHGIRAEGLVTTDEHDKQHPHKGNAERQRKIIALEFGFLGKIHGLAPEFAKYLIVYHDFP
jgi:hypothetical protein